MTIRKQGTKRNPSNAADTKVEIMQDAIKGTLKPPKHVTLQKQDLPFWNSIVRARARALWTEADLENAANLARCKSDIERITRQTRLEGDVIENKKGTPIVNPKHALLETLSRRCMALSRMLHVHAEATTGSSKDAGDALAAERQAEDAMKGIEPDVDTGLIATPRTVN